MGIRSSSESNKEYELMIDQFQVLQQNPNQGLRYLENRQTKQEFLLREISCHDKDAFLKIEETFRNKKAQLDNNRHVTPLVKIMTNSQDQFCMTFFKVYALFEFPQRTLDDQINERGLQRRRFQEKELWSILASCILGLSHLQKNNIKHSALRSNTILISADGIIKVYDPITTGCSSNYDTLLSHRQTPHTYISPEQVEGLKQQKISPEHQPFKTDIWTLGMIILEAGLLSYQDECYRDQYSRIHWETLQYNINLFQQTYSSELTNLVQFMLGKDERARPDWSQLEQHVIKVEEDVRGSTIGGQSKKKDAFSYQQAQPLKKIQKLLQNKPFGADRHMSQSRTPSEMNMAASKTQNANRIGIARSKERATNGSMTYQTIAQSIKPSEISLTRPYRSVFPVSAYVSQTRPDQNMIPVAEQEKLNDSETQKYGIPSVNNFIGRSLHQNGIHFSPIQSASIPNQQITSQSYSYQNGHPLYLQQNPVSPPLRVDLPNPVSIRSTPFQTFQTPSQGVHFESSNRTKADGQYVAEQYKQGSRYQGYKLNGQKHGYGKFYYQDGGLYEGNWKFNKMQGQGKLYYQSDRIAYDGQWHNDQFSGRGTLYNQFPEPLAEFFDYRNFDQIEEYWVKYEGDFFEDMKHGWGVLHLSNGQYFEGEFRNDYADGTGTFVTKQGNEIRGRWHSNVMD